MKGTSKELQEISLVALVNDPYLLSKCMKEINEEFYINSSFKLIYKCLKDYYTRYMTVPTEKEMSIIVTKAHSENYGLVQDAIDAIDRIYKTEISSENFLYEQVTDFIRRNKIEYSLNKAIGYMEDGEIDLDRVALDLRDSIYLNFAKSPVYNLSDVSNLNNIKEDALGSVDNPVIVKFFIDSVNWCMQYGGLIPGTLNMVTAPPGNGKTTMLINQGISTGQQGFTCLHVFLGDMKKYDGLIRYLSCLSGVDTKTIIGFTEPELKAFIQKYNMSGVLSNIFIASYGADELSVSQLLEEIMSIQKEHRVHFNMIIIDYDENLSEEQDNMYKSGGDVYNKVALFATINKSVIMIAAQPKPAFWKCEVIPLEGASESSKKQKIIDLMLTMGKPGISSSVGTIFIAKNRRGQDNKLIRISINGENAQMKNITEEEYVRSKQMDNPARTTVSEQS